MKQFWITVMVFILSASGAVWAHGEAPHKAKAEKKSVSTEQHPFGREGDARKVTRTIAVGMDDSMHYSPNEIRVKQGETVKFVARNNGKIMHEMVIGTMKELKAHGELMKKFPGMEHDEPYMAHVAPGKSEQIVWQFTKAGEFYYACLIPGHLEAGMIGKVVVK